MKEIIGEREIEVTSIKFIVEGKTYMITQEDRGGVKIMVLDNNKKLMIEPSTSNTIIIK